MTWVVNILGFCMFACLAGGAGLSAVGVVLATFQRNRDYGIDIALLGGAAILASGAFMVLLVAASALSGAA